MSKVALVTGGGRGIGYGISKSLALEGYNLAICGVRDESAVLDSLQSLRDTGVKVLYCQADVGDERAREAMINEIKQTFGKLNVLVNNAGVAPSERKDILEASPDSFDRLIKINLKGPYFLTQLAANWMIEQKKSDNGFHSCIINISSISSTVASVNRGDYCISKAGISMATQLWAVRLSEFDIPVFEVRPGIIKTDMTSAVQQKYDKLIKEGLMLQSRWGLPEDVGKAVAMLAREDLPYSTGQVVMVDGGMTVPRL